MKNRVIGGELGGERRGGDEGGNRIGSVGRVIEGEADGGKGRVE